jgi:hypothetical protein
MMSVLAELHMLHDSAFLHLSPFRDRRVEEDAVQIAPKHLITGVIRGELFDTFLRFSPPHGMTPAANKPGLVNGRQETDTLEELPGARWKGLP